MRLSLEFWHSRDLCYCRRGSAEQVLFQYAADERMATEEGGMVMRQVEWKQSEHPRKNQVVEEGVLAVNSEEIGRGVHNVCWIRMSTEATWCDLIRGQAAILVAKYATATCVPVRQMNMQDTKHNHCNLR